MTPGPGWYPIITGGGQERGLRSGTLAPPLVAGFGEAARLMADEHAYDQAHIRRLSEKLKQGLLSIPETQFNGVLSDESKQYPGCVNISFAYIEGESLLMALKDIALSSGSACTSASLEPSYVLHALGADDAWLTRPSVLVSADSLPRLRLTTSSVLSKNVWSS